MCVKERAMVARTERFAHSRFAHSAGERFVVCVVLRVAPCSKTRRVLLPVCQRRSHDRPEHASVQTRRDVT